MFGPAGGDVALLRFLCIIENQQRGQIEDRVRTNRVQTATHPFLRCSLAGVGRKEAIYVSIILVFAIHVIVIAMMTSLATRCCSLSCISLVTLDILRWQCERRRFRDRVVC